MSFVKNDATFLVRRLPLNPAADPADPARGKHSELHADDAGASTGEKSPARLVGEARALRDDQSRASGRPPRQAPLARGTTRTRKTLGSVLRSRRHELQLTQRELAGQLGVKPAHIAYLELDRRRPSLSLLNRIAEVLDLDRERLILLSHPEARSFIGATKRVEAAPAKDQAWREFKRNKNVLSRYKVSKQEMQVLSQVALLGRVTTPRSFLFILNSIRHAVEDAEV
jgi:transcriptional regulator with XRE-family HTH domain